MARYWVGGTGTSNGTAGTKWATSSGGAGGAAIPTAADDVFFDAVSGVAPGTVVTISSLTCRSLNCTGFGGAIAGTLSHSSSVTISIGDATAGASNVALLLEAGMTYTLGSASTSALSFISTSATQQTITTGGKTLGNWTVNGAGSSYLLGDTNSTGTTATVTLTTGTLSTNGQTCAWGFFSSSNSNTRVLTITSSAITIAGGGTSWNTATTTGLTLNAGSSTITMSGATGSLSASNTGGLTYGSIVFSGAGQQILQSVSNSFVNITRTGTAALTDSFQVSASGLTITGVLTLASNSNTNRLLVFSSVVGTARTITAASVVITNTVDFMDIVGAGAATWTVAGTGATALGDAGGNSGITFTTPATQTHTASAGGNWSDVTKWTSRVPLPQDNVIVDAQTTLSLTADMPRLGKDLTFTGFAGTCNFFGALAIYGSLTLASGMTFSVISGSQTFAGRGTHTITMAGKVLNLNTQTFAAVGGTYTLQDAFSATALVVSDGTFVDGGFSVTATTFTSNSGRTRSLTRTGAWTITSTAATTVWNVSATGLTMTNTGSSVTISIASTNSRTFAGGGFSYGTLTYAVAGSTGALVITGANTFATLNFSDVTNARTLTLPSSTTTTIGIGGWNVNGTSGKLMTVNSSTGGTQATLSMASGVVASDYLSIQDSNAGGGATWYAGANSTNVSNNTGWIFTIPTYPISASDTGTGTDAFSAILGTLSASQTATGTDSFLALTGTITAADTGTGTDLGIGVLISQGGSDTGTGTDSGSLTATLSGAESGTGTDVFAALVGALTASDVASGADSGILSAAITGSDTGTAVDLAGSIFATLTASDVGVMVDAVLALVGTVSASDSGVGVDSVADLTALVTGADSGVGIDTGTLLGLLVGSEDGTGLDLASLFGSIFASDSGEGIDTAISVVPLVTNVSDSDSGTGVDTGLLLGLISGSEDGAGIEVGSLIGALSDSDSAAGLDSFLALLGELISSDSGTGTDTAGTVTVFASDAGTGTDTSIMIAMSASESATGVEGAPIIGVFASDSGVGVEAGTVVVFIVAVFSVSQHIFIRRLVQRIRVEHAVLNLDNT